MVQVKRANVVMRIPDSEVKRYLDMGYDILDDEGNVITKTVPTDIGTLQKAFKDMQREIAELERENKELRAQLAKASKEPKQSAATATNGKRGKRS